MGAYSRWALIKFSPFSASVVSLFCNKTGCLFEAGHLLTFSPFRMGTYSRWALIRGWALIQINMVIVITIIIMIIIMYVTVKIIMKMNVKMTETIKNKTTKQTYL